MNKKKRGGGAELKMLSFYWESPEWTRSEMSILEGKGQVDWFGDNNFLQEVWRTISEDYLKNTASECSNCVNKERWS